jgi:Leucine-rich repeat (LRR) protein
VPLTLTVEYDETFLPGPEEDALLILEKTVDGIWTVLESTWDPEANTVSAPINSFSYIRVRYIEPAFIDITEEIAVTDAVNVIPPVVLEIQETITVSDAVELTPPVVIEIFETVTVSDAVDIPPLPYVRLAPASADLSVGQTVQLQASLRQGELVVPGVSFTWASSNSAVALVNSTGLVTAMGEGEAMITAAAVGRPESGQATITVSTGTGCVTQSQIPAAECEALVSLYNTTGGDSWTENTNWLDYSDPCAWFGVTCSLGSVSTLALQGNNLTGPLPPEIGSLSNLRFLYLQDNNLTGPIPSEIGDLASLLYLYLGENPLGGSIPARITDLTGLRILYLPKAQLEGPIPADLGTLADLESVILFGNQLTGTIPAGLGQLTKLKGLYLSANQLTGSIPTQLGNITSLTGLRLSINDLSGEIPSSLGSLVNLDHLWLQNNRLTGAIPTTLGNLSNLGQLELQSNLLTGPIPRELGALRQLTHLYLAGNQLDGQVPIEVAVLGGKAPLDANCSFVPPGNDGLFLPGTPEYVNADTDGDGEICGLPIEASEGGWVPGGDLLRARRGHSLVTLPSGLVLVVGGTGGGAELYDPATGTSTDVPMVYGRNQGARATPLADGKILITGGRPDDTAEIFDPGTGAFTETDGRMNGLRFAHTATLLQDGRVLIAGGTADLPTGREDRTDAELYDPATGTFSLITGLNDARYGGGNALLPNGQVLIVGGHHTTSPGYAAATTSAELFDPATETFGLTGSPWVSLDATHAILLPTGQVFVPGRSTVVQLYDPASGTFANTGEMTQARSLPYTATLLADGRVLIAGGNHTPAGTAVTLASAEIYDPATGQFTQVAPMGTARQEHLAVLLLDGRVLVTGGYDHAIQSDLSSVEIFTAGSGG